MTTPNYFGWTDDKASDRFAMQCEMNNALVWAAEQSNANDKASALYIEQMEQATEISSDNEWLEDGPLYFWGGEVCEYRPDSHLEGQYDEMNGDMEMPF